MAPPVACQVLIVEDEPTIRLLLADLLSEAGYTVATTPNGEKALAYLRQAPPPKLILLDLMMPVMDGWHFRAVQSADPQLRAIPTIVLSANATLEQRAGVLAPQAYLPKPLDVEQLLALVATYCAE